MTAGRDSASSPTKSRRGRSQGSKKLKVCVTDLHLVELVSGISDVDSTQPRSKRGRPRPSHTKHTEDQGSANDSELQGSEDDDDNAEDLANSGSAKPEGGGNEGSPATIPRKRGRPKGSLNKYRRGMWESFSSGAEDDEGRINLRRGRGRPRKLVSHTEETPNGVSDRPRRGRGRPRKSSAPASGLAPGLATGEGQQVKRGRGRPKGSLNKKPRAQPPVQMFNLVRRRRPGRPKKREVRKRGRPRKNPLPSPEELKKPKVWKPLGRPRKYPRPDPLDDVPQPPRRKRGRPRKSSRKGAHLRKPRSLRKPAKALPPPPTHRKEGEAPRKRGRPKGSLNKNRFRGEIEIPSLNRITSSPSNVEMEAAAAGSDKGEE